MFLGRELMKRRFHLWLLGTYSWCLCLCQKIKRWPLCLSKILRNCGRSFYRFVAYTHPSSNFYWWSLSYYVCQYHYHLVVVHLIAWNKLKVWRAHDALKYYCDMVVFIDVWLSFFSWFGWVYLLYLLQRYTITQKTCFTDSGRQSLPQ
jgi:hypothetical protein